MVKKKLPIFAVLPMQFTLEAMKAASDTGEVVGYYGYKLLPNHKSKLKKEAKKIYRAAYKQRKSLIKIYSGYFRK